MKFWKKFKEVTSTVTALKDDETGLFIPNRQLSWVVAAVLLFGFLTFITGYFWGQRKAIERFVYKVEEESFADKISYALYTMNDQEPLGSEDTDDSNTDTNDIADSVPQETSQSQIKIAKVEEVPAACALVDRGIEQKVKEEKKESDKIFVAPLAGFGTLHAASSFARRARKYDPGIQVKTRVSKTSKGKAIAWYQAVTGEFEDREELERVIKQVKKHEHIKDIKVIEKRKVIRT